MLATATTSIAWVIFTVTLLGWVIYFFANRRAAQPELGSEIELAANRKPYFDDEILEGARLERVQMLGVLFLAILVIALPLYWVFEPMRMDGATEQKEATFIAWGSELFATTDEGGYNCAGCHGADGGGGSAPYTLTDQLTGEVTSVTWTAPALNTVLYRFSESELEFILVYGRPFSPMSPWGLLGGGPLNSQQIETLISKIRDIQIPREGCLPTDKDARVCPSGTLPTATKADIDKFSKVAAQKLVDSGEYATVDEAMGEALFNLDLAGGAYSCARCHTQGWSYGKPGVTGQGAYGWNLTGGATASHFPDQVAMETFVKTGSEFGKRYGLQAQGSGRMPGFGNLLTDEQITAIVEFVRSL